MTVETPNDGGNDDVNEHSPVAVNNRRWSVPGKTSHHVLLSLVLFVVLSLVILSVNEETENPGQTRENEETSTIALSEPPISPQALSPQALQDLRAAPTSGLEIQSEPLPIQPLPLPEQNADTEVNEEQVMQEREQESGTDDFSLGEALARYLLAMRDELNREYVENCIQFRSRNGLGAACPGNPAIAAGTNQEEKALVDELFSILTRESEITRISRQLERENATLGSILADPANPAALQASTKLALNNSYLEYLNGNPNPAVTAFERMNAFINDYNRTILSGPVQFNCQDDPCVYEYTGPGAE